MPQKVLRCPACDAAGSRSAASEARFLGLPAGYGMSRCSACGLFYLNPRPTRDEYAELYGKDPFYDPARYAPLMERQAPFFTRKWKDLEARLGGPGTALDLGCGPGWLLAVGARRGWRVAGTELSAPFRRYAREQLGLDVRSAAPDDTLPFPDGRFDAVILNHVVEHLTDPVRCLREVRRVLRDDGMLLVEVPFQLHSLKERLRGMVRKATVGWGYGRVWRDKDVPLHHALYFSPATLLQTVRRDGFRPLRMRTYLCQNPCSNAGHQIGGRWITEGIHLLGSCFRLGPVVEILAGPQRAAGDGAA
jgi:SAM-dependent methyltransferase